MALKTKTRIHLFLAHKYVTLLDRIHWESSELSGHPIYTQKEVLKETCLIILKGLLHWIKLVFQRNPESKGPLFRRTDFYKLMMVLKKQLTTTIRWIKGPNIHLSDYTYSCVDVYDKISAEHSNELERFDNIYRDIEIQLDNSRIENLLKLAKRGSEEMIKIGREIETS